MEVAKSYLYCKPEDDRIWDERPLSKKFLSRSDREVHSDFYAKELKCSLDCFPHIKYMHKMIKLFERKLKNIEATCKLSFEWSLSETMEVILYIPSNISEENKRLLPTEIGENEFHVDIANIWPASVLVYFQGEKESLEIIKKKIRGFHNRWSGEIIVLSPGTKFGSQSVAQNTFTIVDCNKKSIREAIFRCLEAPVSHYLKEKMKQLTEIAEESHRCRLKSEILSLQTLLSETTPCKPVMRIPNKIKDYLFGNPSVLSFALWEGKSLRITVKDTKCKYDIEQELKTLDTEESFLQSHILEILKGNVKVTLYVGQGDKLYPGHLINDSETKGKCDTASSNSEDVNSNIQYGTLGAFLEEITSKGLYGITCRHVIPHEHEKVFMEIQKNDLPSEVGQSVYISENQWEDFAVFKVNDFMIDQCIKIFHNDDDEESNVEVHRGNDLDNWIVHKKGARTGWTTGRILSRECYSSLIPVKHEVFLVGGFDEDYFARTGDSGSVVFMRKSSQSTVSVLGMVFGGMENIYNDHQPEIEKSTMCFLLDNALSNLSVQNRLELQFVPREQSSNDSD